MIWEQWKKGFEVWEGKTAEVLETILKKPAVLGPMGSMLTATMKVKAKSDAYVAQWWAMMGLPTRRDQERTLHVLNQLNSRLLDLEEQLNDLEERRKN
jgi:hypothetical protein